MEKAPQKLLSRALYEAGANTENSHFSQCIRTNFKKARDKSFFAELFFQKKRPPRRSPSPPSPTGEEKSRRSSNGSHAPFISFGELHGKHFDAENKKSAPKREVLGTVKDKIPSQKSLSFGNLLKNARMCGIIPHGRRLSDCIGVLFPLLCRAIVFQYGSSPFLYYTTISTVCQPLLRICLFSHERILKDNRIIL